MKTKRPPAAFAMFLLAAFLALPGACTTAGTPPPNGQGTAVDCFKGIPAATVADAVSRVNTTMVSGIQSGAMDEVIEQQVLGLAADVTSSALACALQYVASKFSYDGEHDQGEPAARSRRGAAIARKAIADAGFTYATPSGAPPN